MNSAYTRIVVVKKKGPWSGGFGSINDIQEIPANYYGCIWAERFDRISDYIKEKG